MTPAADSSLSWWLHLLMVARGHTDRPRSSRLSKYTLGCSSRIAKLSNGAFPKMSSHWSLTGLWLYSHFGLQFACSTCNRLSRMCQKVTACQVMGREHSAPSVAISDCRRGRATVENPVTGLPSIRPSLGRTCREVGVYRTVQAWPWAGPPPFQRKLLAWVSYGGLAFTYIPQPIRQGRAKVLGSAGVPWHPGCHLSLLSQKHRLVGNQDCVSMNAAESICKSIPLGWFEVRKIWACLYEYGVWFSEIL